MDPRPITPRYHVAPQIEPGDMQAIAAAGYRAVICNRPDAEVPPSHRSDVMAEAAAKAGLAFHALPVTRETIGPGTVAEQAALVDTAAENGPVLAYCASGTRCTILWALSEAGHEPADVILARTAEAGYPLEQLRAQIEAFARG